MALQIQTKIKINASATAVWAVLMDTASYREWNPFISQVEGEFKQGDTVKITAGGMAFKPTILIAEPGRELRWLGQFMFKGLFDGEHQFRILPQADNSVILEHGEAFSGILVSLFAKTMLEKTKAGFEAMNQALKERVEAQVAELSN